VIKAEFSVSHDPSEIIIIWCSRNIYDYYLCENHNKLYFSGFSGE